NGATFLVSAGALALTHFGDAPSGVASGEGHGLLRQARAGVRTIAGMPGVRTLVLASSGVILFAAMLNVIELLLARSLGAGAAGYSLLVASGGVGVVAGSLSAAGGAALPE